MKTTIQKKSTASNFVKSLCAIWLLLYAIPTAYAQTSFAATNLPHLTGEFYCDYFSTNVNVGTLVSTLGGPQVWDLSQPQQVNETIHRFDLVPVSDGDDGGDFPNATYSEQETDENTGDVLAWSNFSLNPSSGRSYYGFVVTDPFVDEEVVFDNPTVDIPGGVQFNQKWNRVVDYSYLDPNDLSFKSVVFTDQSSADAYGNVNLNGIGLIPALRISELHVEADYDLFSGNLMYTMTNTYYYWLAPGLGIVGELTLFSQNPQLSTLPFTNCLYRTFATSLRYPVSGLAAQREGNSIQLTWAVQTGAGSYRIEYKDDLSIENWTLLSLQNTNVYSDATSSPRRFYRIFSVQ